jgi:hypothetical protein
MLMSRRRRRLEARTSPLQPSLSDPSQFLESLFRREDEEGMQTNLGTSLLLRLKGVSATWRCDISGDGIRSNPPRHAHQPSAHPLSGLESPIVTNRTM